MEHFLLYAIGLSLVSLLCMVLNRPQELKPSSQATNDHPNNPTPLPVVGFRSDQVAQAASADPLRLPINPSGPLANSLQPMAVSDFQDF